MLFSAFRQLLNGGISFPSLLMQLAASLFVVFCTMPVHESAHAFAADKLGDKTARLSGRLTLNPMAHINPLGAVMILLFGFGYANPVPVNPRNFKMKNKKAGMAITAAAGPISNILMAFIFYFFAVIFTFLFENSGMTLIIYFFQIAAQINVMLAVFNLLPIPPLDGSKILAIFLPGKYYYKLMQYERYVILVVFGLLFIGILDIPLNFLENLISKLLISASYAIANLIF